MLSSRDRRVRPARGCVLPSARPRPSPVLPCVRACVQLGRSGGRVYERVLGVPWCSLRSLLLRECLVCGWHTPRSTLRVCVRCVVTWLQGSSLGGVDTVGVVGAVVVHRRWVCAYGGLPPFLPWSLPPWLPCSHSPALLCAPVLSCSRVPVLSLPCSRAPVLPCCLSRSRPPPCSCAPCSIPYSRAPLLAPVPLCSRARSRPPVPAFVRAPVFPLPVLLCSRASSNPCECILACWCFRRRLLLDRYRLSFAYCAFWALRRLRTAQRRCASCVPWRSRGGLRSTCRRACRLRLVRRVRRLSRHRRRCFSVFYPLPSTPGVSEPAGHRQRGGGVGCVGVWCGVVVVALMYIYIFFLFH